MSAGNSAGGVRPRDRRVGTVVLAALQKGAMGAGRDDRTHITLGEGNGRPRDTAGKTEEHAKREVARQLLRTRRGSGGRAEKGKRRAVDRSPDGGRKGAFNQEVAEGLRDPAMQQTMAEKAMRVSGTAAGADMVRVMNDPEQRVPCAHSSQSIFNLLDSFKPWH